MRAWLGKLAAAVSLRDVEFYGGLALVGAAPGRWVVVGAVLAAHAWLTPLLAGLTARRG